MLGVCVCGGGLHSLSHAQDSPLPWKAAGKASKEGGETERRADTSGARTAAREPLVTSGYGTFLVLSRLGKWLGTGGVWGVLVLWEGGTCAAPHPRAGAGSREFS